jgi:hypothetical protein
LQAQHSKESAGLAEAGQADLAALLLDAGLQTAPGDPAGLARLTAAMLRGSPAGLLAGNRMSFSA